MNCYIVFLVMMIQKFSMYLKCGLAWMNLIISFYHCLSSSKKDQKNSGLNGDSNPDLCNASAVPTSWAIIVIYFHIYGLIIDPHNDLLPVGLIAELVEDCTGITGFRVWIIIQAWVFQAFLTAASAVVKCNDQIHSVVFFFSSVLWLPSWECSCTEICQWII